MAVDIKSRLHRLKDQLHEWFKETDDMMVDLEELAKNLDEHFSNISKAKVGGSTAAVAGGLLAAAGIGLSFFTFGSSLSLVAAGSLIGGTGGLVVAGSRITDAVLSKNRRDTANTILEKYKSRIEPIMKECVAIGRMLEVHGNVDDNFPAWVSFWSSILIESGADLNNIAWDVIGTTIASYLRLVASANQAVVTEGPAAVAVFRAIGTAAGRNLRVAGGVLGILFLPYDIYTLVDSSIDVHKDNHNETSKKIRKMAAKMKTERPTREDIDKMVNATVSRIASLTKCR